ncbi:MULTISPECIES: hypothetical protein [unclassified Mesorhizobium]|uniref:hypothetical protein n=1 Tax=unclassified Mesorhizobium TaxID=325217 RepID=UPI0013E2ED20|nr:MULTISPECIES: hypothetical protein [unclassified Mesorhizobium]
MLDIPNAGDISGFVVADHAQPVRCDLAPWGKNENGLEFPQAWWRRHDEYGNR